MAKVMTRDKQTSSSPAKVTTRYNQSKVYGWQAQNKSALDLLNEYYNRINAGEWLSNEDRAKYKSAIDTYTTTGNALRDVSKFYGTKYTDEEEKSWQDSLSSLNQGYTSVNDFYGQFADDREYGVWKQGETYKSVLNQSDFDNYYNAGINTANPDNNSLWRDRYTGKDVNNMVTLAESGIVADAFNNGDLEDPYNSLLNTTNLISSFMSGDEKKVYNYYVGKGDKAKADEYLNWLIENELKKRQAGHISNVTNNRIGELGTAFNAGMQSGMQGIYNAVQGILNTGNLSQASSMQIATAYNKQDNTGVWGVMNDLANTTGNMVPSIAIGMLNPTAGNIAMGVSAGGNAYTELINEGYSPLQAKAYGGLVGASEALLGKWLGGITSLGGGKGLIQSTLSKVMPAVSNAALRTIGTLGKNMVSEFTEEALQTALEPALKYIATGGKAEYNAASLEEILYSGFLGALSAGALEGIPTIANGVSLNQTSQRAYGAQSPEIVAQALELNPNDKLAKVAQTRLDKGKNVSGLALNELVGNIEQGYIKQDTGKIKSAVENRLTELGERGNVAKISDAIAREQAGEELSLGEKNLIKKSDFGKSVRAELNPETLKSDTEMNRWAESIGTRRLNSDVYSKRPSVKVQTNEGKSSEIGSIKSVKGDVATPSGAVQSKPYESASADLIEEAAQDKMSKVPGFTEEAANVMRKGYDGRMLPSEYIRTFDEAYSLGLNGAQATSVVNLAHDTEGINQSTLLAAYDLGRQAKEKSVLQTPTESDIINTESEALTNEGTSEGAGIHLRRGSEWNDGSYPQEQVSGLDSRPRTNQTWGEGSRPADSEAINLANEGREVRVAELGILNGSKTQTVRLVDANKETTAMKKARKDAESRGLKIKFFVGDNITITEKTGEISAVRAYVLGDTMLVRADHPVYTADQLERHEAGHVRIERGEINQKDVRKRLEELVGKETIESVVEQYAELYASAGMTAEEIWEECICDFLGDINIFSKSANGSLVVKELINQTQAITKEQKTEPNQTRGSPEASLSNTRDGKNGWGKKFGTAQEALNDAIQSVDTKLWNSFNKEFDSNTTNPPITNAINAVMQDVRQDTITPMQGAMLLSQTYEDGGVDALSKLYNHKTGNLHDNVLDEAKQIGEGKASREIEAVTKITADMTEEERYELLKDKKISAHIYKGEADMLIAEELEGKTDRFVKKAIITIANKLGIIGGEINFQDIDVKIILSNSNLRESLSKKANPEQIAKLLPILSITAEKSIVIERHDNRYYYDTDTVYFDNLLGAYIDGDNLIPVRFGLKHSKMGTTTLYVVVDQNKVPLEKLDEIKNDRGHQDASPTKEESNNLRRSVTYSISQIISFVNSKDLLRYLPDGMLTENQRAAKWEAIAETIKKTNEKNDKKYAEYIEKGNLIAAKQMVMEAAKKAGYDYHLYHGTDADFTKFDLRKHGGQNGKGEGYGIYLAANREIAAPYGKNVINSYTKFNRLAEGRKKTLSSTEVKNLIKRSCELEAKQMIDDGEYDSISEALKDTWVSNVVYTYGYSGMEQVYNDVSKKLWSENDNDGDLINEIMALSGAHYDYNNALKFYENILTPITGIDGFHYIWGNKDGSGVQNDIYLAFNSEQIKSADPVTYDDDGNIIPLSERFNSENNDIRYSRELDVLDYITHDEELESVDETAFSNRTLLANALLDTITSSEEYKLVRSYQEEIAKLDAGDKRLAQLKKDLNQLYKQEKPNLEVIRELREKITALESEIVNRDKRLLRLESTTALKNVLERARKDAYAKAMQKGKETMHRAVESRHKTIERNKAKKTAHELEMLLNKNDKKRNVKLGEQAIVRAALDLSDMYFTSDDELIMNGIQTPALDRENDALAQYRALYDRLHATDNDVTNHKEERAQLRHEMNEVKKGLKDLLERERRRINNTQASSVYDAVINEYRKLQASPDTYVSRAFDTNVLAHLEKLKTDLGNKLVSEMTLEELKGVNNAFSMIKHMVVNSNKMFREGRSEDLQERSIGIFSDVSNVGKEKKDQAEIFKILQKIEKLGWDNLRPVDAFELIGSAGLTDLFWDAVSAQDVYARDVVEYQNALEKARRKYGYKNWEFKPVTTFKTADGKELKLTLGEMMSIYAYSKRAQADEHLRKGGIQFKKQAIYKDNKDVTRIRSGKEYTYHIDDALRLEIISKLTQKQRAYVEEMQKILTDWGQKGNEVTRVLYGIDLFNEENYFPLRSSHDYLPSANTQLGQTMTTASLVGSAFAKSTVPHASNPIILDSFDAVVHDHIDRMSKYHAYVIPIENLRKILDAQITDSSGQKISLKSKISSRLGDSAVKYLEQYITDLNGGVQQGYDNGLMEFFGKAKGAMVAANLSVWVQQYFSVIRAMNEINPTYFAPFMGESYKQPDMKLYEEMKKYAPITVIKEMGGFDVGAHGSVAQYVGFNEAGWSREKVSQKMQDAFGVGANVMDKLGWMTIWKAVKKEVAETNQYKLGSEEFYKACGKRMNEVITKTQVYDSVNARSGNMRKKSDWWKMATSFLGEPTTIAGMATVDFIKLKRAIASGNKEAIGAAIGKCVGTMVTISISTAMTSIFKSLIYAMRDEDEDETYWEKYASALAGAFRDDVSLLGYYPILRDLKSMWQGYTIERPDMQLFEDAINSYKKLFIDKDEEESAEQTFEEAINFMGSITNFFSIPMKNIVRDLWGLYNTVTNIGNGYKTNLKDAIKEGYDRKENTKSYNIYVAELRGDTNRINYYKSTYKDDKDNSKYYSALRKAIRENDPRVETAAKARLEGDNDTYYNLMYDIIEEGHFDSKLIKQAFEAEYNSLKEKKKEAEDEE